MQNVDWPILDIFLVTEDRDHAGWSTVGAV